MKTTLELADIFRIYGTDDKQQYKGHIPYQHKRVMDAIQACRTPALGAQLYGCDTCGYQHTVYFSCRNRHCPKCQALPTYQWVEKRKQDLLPIPYFHVVFTLPEQLRSIALKNQRCVYDILFKAASDTLKALAEDPRHLGARIGFLSVLHTWSQTLAYHPHLHCIVTGGGLSPNNQHWIHSKENFFIHVNVLSKLFKGKFLALLKLAHQQGKLKYDPYEHFGFKACIDKLYRTKWNVYSKAPFGGPKHVIAYLAQYTHRVAISNQRILKIQDGEVYFLYRDRKDGDQVKTMKLPVFTFIQRFLFHVLPKNFVKIRYFGILANRTRNNVLAHCRKLLCIKSQHAPENHTDTSYLTLLKTLTGVDPTLCPRCENGHLQFKGILLPAPNRAPPALAS